MRIERPSGSAGDEVGAAEKRMIEPRVALESRALESGALEKLPKDALKGGRARSLSLVAAAALVGAFIRYAAWPASEIQCAKYGAAAVGGVSGRERVECIEEGAKSQGRLPLGAARALSLRIDLNSLDQDDFESLAAVGPKLAKKIVEERDSRGGFGSVDELAEVKGIGPARMAVLRALFDPARQNGRQGP